MSWAEVLFIAVLAMVLVGPEHLPQYAKTAARWVRRAQRALADTKETVEQQLGTSLPESLAPRDIVRTALAAVDPPVAGAPQPDAVPLADPREVIRASLGLPAPAKGAADRPGAAPGPGAASGTGQGAGSADPRAIIRASLAR